MTETTLHKFLTFNKRCPICNNPLTLYMQWIKAGMYMGNEQEPGGFYFTEFNIEKMAPKALLIGDEECDYVYLTDYTDQYEIAFSTPSFFNEAKKYIMYFFYLCKPQGFRNNFEINLVQGCYYRSTPLMEFQKVNGVWKLDYKFQEFNDIVNKDESFCLKSRKEGLDKFYMLNRDLEKQITEMWYFSVTDEQRVDKKFKPEVFFKELPLIQRPSFENKGKILERIQSWILMS